MKILALSGSLRTASTNSMLLRAAARLAPAEMDVSSYAGLGSLPLFNPDLEVYCPASVIAFRQAVADADALLFASPEYAHGVTGTIKNALDWLVSFEPFASKIVAVWNASPRAHYADDSLREILRTMAAVIVDSARISIPLLGSGLDESGVVAASNFAEAIRASLRAIEEAVQSRRSSSGPEFLLQ
jgi:NAD(P)H-dependent FMN reductase